MSLSGALQAACRFFAEELDLPRAVAVAAEPLPEGWKVVLEAIVEDTYMRERAKRDIVAQFDVVLDTGMNVLSFTRKEMRERGSL